MVLAAMVLGAIAGPNGPRAVRAQSMDPAGSPWQMSDGGMPAAPDLSTPDAAAPQSAPEPATRLPTNSRDILVDPMTGLALLGYDPVAYFVDRKPRRGERRYELFWSGVVWRFVNEGNMAAFEAAPEVYAPQFGGYDPLVLASGPRPTATRRSG
ncbi:hypothetical protein [Breoghania sp. L-A4]|uniref:hypothetical protein n=1 Tax=Breoghania sp. L-A4 TaxID=2304600 RepID=UPI000E35AE06|nr:hypothetical protein [Breoghania sp. L-A4]AXS41752.1 hypothetical protein D1F64_19235 [Breoghania sp. L-A4]